MADPTSDRAVEVLAWVFANHAWDYARNRCACSAPGVVWLSHPKHVAQLQLDALRRKGPSRG